MRIRSGGTGSILLAISSYVQAFPSPGASIVPKSSSLHMSSTAATSFYSLSGVRSDGSAISMSDLEGKVVYATNVASK